MHGRVFDGSVSAGTFVSGHLGSDVVPAMIATLRPGAPLVWSVVPPVWPDVQRALLDVDVTIVRAGPEVIRSNADRSYMVVGVVGAGER